MRGRQDDDVGIETREFTLSTDDESGGLDGRQSVRRSAEADDLVADDQISTWIEVEQLTVTLLQRLGVHLTLVAGA